MTATTTVHPKTRSRFGRGLHGMFRTLIGDPVAAGRLRLDGVDATTWTLCAVAVVGLAGLLGSLAFGDLWRTGRFADVGSADGRPVFAPEGVLAPTLAVLAFAWVLLLWGASRATPIVRVAVGLLFIVLNGFLASTFTVAIGDSFALQHGPEIVVSCYYGAAGLVMGSALLPWNTRWGGGRLVPLATAVASGAALFTVTAAGISLAAGTGLFAGLLIGSLLIPWTPAWEPRLRVVLLGAMAATVVVFFFAHLWIHAAAVASGQPGGLAIGLNGALGQIRSLTIPLLFLAAVAIVDFSYNAADAAASPWWRTRPAVARSLLFGLIATKLWVQVARHVDDLRAFVTQRPAVTAFTLAMLALLLVLAVAVRRGGAGRVASEGTKDRLFLRAALLLAAPGSVILLLLTFSVFLTVQLGSFGAASSITNLPLGDWPDYLDPAIWLLVLVTGVVLVRRRDALARDAGFGWVMVAAWVSLIGLLALFKRLPGLEPALIDIGLTVGVLLFAFVRFARLDTRTAVLLGAIVGFSWLVTTEGDLILILSNLLGLPAIVVVVFGVVWTLLAGSAFANGDSRRFPRPARPLLWLGFLLLSLSIANWTAVTHGVDPTIEAGTRAFSYLGLPIAAWLVARRPFAPPADDESADQADHPEPRVLVPGDDLANRDLAAP